MYARSGTVKYARESALVNASLKEINQWKKNDKDFLKECDKIQIAEKNIADSKKPKLNATQQRQVFLETLRKTGVVLRACEAAGITRVTAYNWRKKDTRSAKKFEEAWNQALEDKWDEFEEVVFNAGLGEEEGTPDPDMAFRILSRRRYKTWGNVEKHQIEGDFNPITIKFGENMADAFIKPKPEDE